MPGEIESSLTRWGGLSEGEKNLFVNAWIIYSRDINQQGVKGSVYTVACRKEGGRAKERAEGDEWHVWYSCWCQSLRAKQTEGDLSRGGLARAERCWQLVGKEESKIDSHTLTAGQMWRHRGPCFSPGYVHLQYTYSYSYAQACSFVHNGFCVFTHRAETHLKRNSACLQIFRLDVYSPWQVSLFALRYLRQRKEDEEERQSNVCVLMYVSGNASSPSTSCYYINVYHSKHFIIDFISCQSDACE